MPQRRRGYNVKPHGPDSIHLVEDMKLICDFCDLILRDAVQTSYGGLRLCYGCYNRIQSQRPRDNYCFSPEKPHIKLRHREKFNKDKAVRNAVSELVVACANRNCSWTGKLKDYENNHEKLCKTSRLKKLFRHVRNVRDVRDDDTSDHKCKCQLNQETVSESSAPQYNMSCSPHGIAVVVCIDSFLENLKRKELGLKSRKGCKQDELHFKDTFRRLGYNVDDHCHRNLTSTELVELVQRIAALDHSEYDSCVFCISTHGEDNHFIFGADSERINLYDLMRIVQSCPTLNGKPKMFFVQACRSPPKDTSQLELLDRYRSDMNIKVNAEFSESDVYLAWPTTRGSRSYRSPIEGSWFPEAIHNQFTKHALKYNLNDLMMFVSEDIKERKGYDQENKETVRECVEIQSCLTKNVFFLKPQVKACMCLCCEQYSTKDYFWWHNIMNVWCFVIAALICIIVILLYLYLSPNSNSILVSNEPEL